MGNGAMDRLKDKVQTTDMTATPVGQSLLEQGATVRQMRLDNYLTAVSVQQPRDKKKVIKEVEFEAELLAEKAYYSWTAKGKDGRSLIEGPSVDLAMVLVREWGNCATRADLVAETGRHFLFDGIYMDLERGVTVIRQFRQVKENRGKGRMDDERAEDIVFQIGQSKALRNAVCAAMPAWLVAKALKKAKYAAAKSMTPDNVVEAFKKWGIDQKTLERRVGKAVKRWDEMDMAELRGVYQALLDGVTTIDNEFGQEQDAGAVAQATEAKVPVDVVDPETGEVTEAKVEVPKTEEPKTEAPKTETTETPKTETPKVTVVKKDANGNETSVGVSPAATKALEVFEGVGITQAQLEAKMEKPASGWARGELNKLKAMIRSIKEGDVEASALFPPAQADAPAGDDEGGSWDE